MIRSLLALMLALAFAYVAPASAQDMLRIARYPLVGGYVTAHAPGLEQNFSGPAMTPIAGRSYIGVREVFVPEYRNLNDAHLLIWSERQFPFGLSRFNILDGQHGVFCIMPDAQQVFPGFEDVRPRLPAGMCIYAIDGNVMSAGRSPTSARIMSAVAEYFNLRAVDREARDYAYVEYVTYGADGQCVRSTQANPFLSPGERNYYQCVYSGMLIPLAAPGPDMMQWRDEITARDSNRFGQAMAGLAGTIVLGAVMHGMTQSVGDYLREQAEECRREHERGLATLCAE